MKRQPKKVLKFTKEQIKTNLSTDQRWMERALVVLHNLQTNEEQQSGNTIEDNKRGFNGVDARYLSYCAKWIKDGNHLNEKHKIKVGKMLPKYWLQISNLIEK